MSLRFKKRSLLQRSMLAALLTLSIGACSSVKPICLPMKTYTAEQQQALSAAMKIAAPGSPFVAFIQDYFQMREANRACLKG